MGTWGEGNFQNDSALDYLAEVIGHLRETVEELLAGRGADVEEMGESHLMPSVEMMALLCERLNGAPPEVEVVASWRSQYLARYDAQIDALSPQGDFKAKRRQVIEETFARLEAAARRFRGA